MKFKKWKDIDGSAIASFSLAMVAFIILVTSVSHNRFPMFSTAWTIMLLILLLSFTFAKITEDDDFDPFSGFD